MQLIAKRFNESILFRLGSNFQEATEFHLQKPKL